MVSHIVELTTINRLFNWIDHIFKHD